MGGVAGGRGRGTVGQMSDQAFTAPGSYRSDHIRDGDPYELRDGHVIKCMTAGERHARANLEGAILTGATLRECDLLGANLTNAQLGPAELAGALHAPSL